MCLPCHYKIYFQGKSSKAFFRVCSEVSGGVGLFYGRVLEEFKGNKDSVNAWLSHMQEAHAKLEDFATADSNVSESFSNFFNKANIPQGGSELASLFYLAGDAAAGDKAVSDATASDAAASNAGAAR